MDEQIATSIMQWIVFLEENWLRLTLGLLLAVGMGYLYVRLARRKTDCGSCANEEASCSGCPFADKSEPVSGQ